MSLIIEWSLNIGPDMILKAPFIRLNIEMSSDLRYLLKLSLRYFYISNIEFSV